MEKITFQSTVVRSNEIVASPLDEESVMMDINQGKYYGLPAVSTYIWNALEEKQSVNALCDQLLARYDVDRETCQAEVLRFLGELSKEELIHVVETAE